MFFVSLNAHLIAFLCHALAIVMSYSAPSSVNFRHVCFKMKFQFSRWREIRLYQSTDQFIHFYYQKVYFFRNFVFTWCHKAFMILTFKMLSEKNIFKNIKSQKVFSKLIIVVGCLKIVWDSQLEGFISPLLFWKF